VIRYSLRDLARRATPGRRGKVILRPIEPSHGAEVAYRKALRGRLADVRVWVREQIEPAYAAERAAMMRDGLTLDVSGEDIGRLLGMLREFVRRLFATAEAPYRITAEAEASRHTDRFASAARAALSVDVKAMLAREDLDGALELAAQRNAALIANLGEDISGRIAATVTTALANGVPNRELSRRIGDQFGIVGRRADLIARDQIAKLNSDLNRLRQTQAGVYSYRWSTSRDERVRLTHRANEGREFRWDRPPAATGHPGADVNCFPGSVKVDLANGCDKFWRRLYSGPLATIETADGAFLEATPNHPVLTSRGWLSVNALQEGDYLIRSVRNGGFIDHLNENDLVSPFDQAFDAACHLEQPETTPGRKSDFHGDGAESQVDVVMLNRFLPSDGMASARQRIEQLLLSWPDVDRPAFAFDGDCSLSRRGDEVLAWLASHCGMRGARKFFALLGRHSAEADVVRGRSISTVHAFLAQNARYRRSFDAVIASDGKLAPAVSVSGDDVMFGKIVAAIGAIRPSANGGVEFGLPNADRLAEVLAVAPEQKSDALQRISPLYKADRVVKKAVCEFSGHVYNLENAQGWYHANGFVVHNCRCVPLGVVSFD
jgi:SPP1 gp7 family putative phage head morphogenesis protein